MKAPITWLKDYVDINISPEALAEKLLSVGFEVEEIDYLGKHISGVVVGKIMKIERHPDADKLFICQVDVGKNNGIVQIVTNSQTVREGDLVPVALHGARLHGGVKITKGKLRGVESDGMFCSGKEFNVGNDVYEGAGLDQVLVIKEKVALGTDIKKVLGLDEYVLDISILANRPDCQSIVGIAREIASALNKPFHHPEITYIPDMTKNISDYVSAEVKNPELCPRYILTAVCDVKLQPSTKAIRDRLRWAGLNSINNIVDITNFVLLELGQPMHAFDADKINNKKIVVRSGKNEKLKLLDNKEYELGKDALCICDDKKPIGIAGVMGGKDGSISDDTKNIVFESAKFNRESIRRTSKKYNVRSDSSAMFEKGVDAYTSRVAMNRALCLIQKLNAGTIVGGEIDILSENLDKKIIKCNVEKIYALLGIEIEVGTMMNILQRLNIITRFENGELVCEIPQYRQDIDGYPHIAEEIIRVYGYENITETLLENASIIQGGLTKQQKDIELTYDTLCSLGFNEIITYSFVGQKAYENINCQSKNAIKLQNPLGEEMSLMRTNLIHYMFNAVALNIHRNQTAGRLFEFAKIYENAPNQELPNEKDRLALCCFGEGEDFFTIKKSVATLFDVLGLEFDVEPCAINYMHPYRTGNILCGNEAVGYMGEVSIEVLEKYDIQKKLYFSEIEFDKIIGKINKAKAFEAISKYPGTQRDIAIVVEDNVLCRDILKTIKHSAGKLCNEVSLFDIYTGKQVKEGCKSLAFTLKFISKERTLTESEVDSAMEKVLKALEETFSAKLRE